MNTKIIGIFDDEETLMQGIGKLKEKNIAIDEVYTPYPVMGAIEAMGKKSKFTIAAFIYGFTAVVLILSFLYYTSVLDWPINYAGKPSASFPSFIIITLVLTIASVTILTLFTFSVRAKIYPGKKFELPDRRATDDKFVVVIDKKTSGKDLNDISGLLTTEGATEVYEKDVELQTI